MMDNFMLLTNEDGTGFLINLRYLKSVFEDEGKTYVSMVDGIPAVVLETIDDIEDRIDQNNGLVI